MIHINISLNPGLSDLSGLKNRCVSSNISMIYRQINPKLLHYNIRLFLLIFFERYFFTN